MSELRMLKSYCYRLQLNRAILSCLVTVCFRTKIQINVSGPWQSIEANTAKDQLGEHMLTLLQHCVLYFNLGYSQ